MIKLHIFAVNGAVINTDCNVNWKEFLAKEGYAPADAAQIAVEFQRSIAAGTVDAEAFGSFLLKEFTGKSKPEIMKIAAKHFEEKIKPAVSKDAFDYIKALIRKGESVAFLTSIDTANAYHIALHFGVSDVIAIGSKIENDAFSGVPSDTCPIGAGKLFQLGRICERCCITPAEVAVYASGMEDIQLLNAAGTKIAVNPSDELADCAKKASWQIVNWK